MGVAAAALPAAPLGLPWPMCSGPFRGDITVCANASLSVSCKLLKAGHNPWMLDQTAAKRGPGGRPGAGAPYAWRAAPVHTWQSPSSRPKGTGLIQSIGSDPVGGPWPFLKIIRRVAPSELQLWPLHRFFPLREPRAGCHVRRSSFPTPSAPSGCPRGPCTVAHSWPHWGAPGARQLGPNTVSLLKYEAIGL